MTAGIAPGGRRGDRILYLIETLGVGGAEQSLLQLLPRLRSVEPIMCHVYNDDTLRPAYEAAGVRVVSLNVAAKYGFLTAMRRVRELVRVERPAIIHTTLFRAEVIGRVVGRQAGVPVVSSFVSECYADIRWRGLSWGGRMKLKGVQMLDRMTAPFVTRFVANSHAVRESESRSLRISPDRVTVIHRGRDPEQFLSPLGEEHGRALRAAMGIPDDAPIVLNVGRLVDSKGQAELIAAFGRVLDAMPNAVLLIAGDGPELEALKQRARGAGIAERVRLLGRRDDVAQLMALAAVFAFPSHYEGHPGAVVEAMFAGRPIVISDIPVHRETIAADETGLVVRVGDVDALARAIVWMLRNPSRAADMGRRARAAATDHFHIDRAAAAYDALYQRVLQESTRRAASVAPRPEAHVPLERGAWRAERATER